MLPLRDDLRPALLLGGLFALVLIAFGARWTQAKAGQCTTCPPSFRMEWVFVAPSLIGAAIGLAKVRGRQRIAEPLPRAAALLFSLALLARGVADSAYYAYYEITGKSPYPSVGDVAFVAEAVLWIAGLALLYWALETTVLEELRSSVDVLIAVWSLTIVAVTLIRGEGKVPNDLGKLALDLFYPFAAATSCAMTSALVFGPQLRRIAVPWRWCLIMLYVGTLLQMLATIAYSLLSSLPADHPALGEFFWEGGPVDFLFALAVYSLALAVALLPRATPMLALIEAGGPPDPPAEGEAPPGM